MPRASHRMDLALVLTDAPDPARFEALRQVWEARGWVRGAAPGPQVDGLIEGGFKRLWLDLPGRLTLYANQQGGFRVTCPSTGGNAAAAFGRALQAWREGGPMALDCPACGHSHPLDALTLAPPGAFGRGAVIFADCAAHHPRQATLAELEDALGPLRTVSRRVG